ncbi:MAG TPA: CheR family methyltransferase, partial [Desulfuromonadales bacterium]|nr:CheR family methyltransferase [Desulfuromonadales bacterium]
IHDELGIKMPETKRTMLAGRLAKRLRVLGVASYREYCDYLFEGDGGGELVHLFDVVTTNKTDFFREPSHFDYLTGSVLEKMRRRPFHLWSAGCSTGEEPYTLTMVLREYAESVGDDFRFAITATDISTRALETARRAIYPHDRIEPVPPPLRKKYLLRSREHRRELVRMVPENRRLVSFQRLNFMDEQFDLPQPFDVIFCRNVIIYFDKETQERLVRKFCRHLQPDGYLFLGHSESLHGLDVPLVPVAPTVYRRAV